MLRNSTKFQIVERPARAPRGAFPESMQDAQALALRAEGASTQPTGVEVCALNRYVAEALGAQSLAADFGIQWRTIPATRGRKSQAHHGAGVVNSGLVAGRPSNPVDMLMKHSTRQGRVYGDPRFPRSGGRKAGTLPVFYLSSQGGQHAKQVRRGVHTHVCAILIYLCMCSRMKQHCAESAACDAHDQPRFAASLLVCVCGSR